MILRVFWGFAFIFGLQGRAAALEAPGARRPSSRPIEEAPRSPEHKPDRSLSRFRLSFDTLTERAIGRTSRRVRFDWRRSPLQIGALAALPAELNNYDSLRAGAFLRLPSADLLFELGLSYVWVSSSLSSEHLALTPYRQPGRSDRFELDLSLAYPIAEGVVTAFPRFFPSTQLVLNAYAQFRYLLYPGAFSGLSLEESLKAILSGSFSDAELENLEEERLPAMEIDPGRYSLLSGLGNDLYFQSGFFISHRLLIALPMLRFMTKTKLGYGFELDLSLGLAF